jgi:hypothetical protein
MAKKLSDLLSPLDLRPVGELCDLPHPAGRVQLQRQERGAAPALASGRSGGCRRPARDTLGAARPPAGAAGGCQGARSRAGGAQVLLNFLSAIVSAWRTGSWDSHEYSPSVLHVAAEAMCQQCLETKDLEEE